MKKHILIALLALVFGTEAFAQEWEYVSTCNANEEICPNLVQSLTELESGNIIRGEEGKFFGKNITFFTNFSNKATSIN